MGESTALRDLLLEHDLGPKELTARLTSLRGVLSRGSLGEIVASYCAMWTSRPTMHDLIVDVDHVGFIGPAGVNVEAVAEAAVAAGFDTETRLIRSVIVAVELGQMRERAEIPTTIFKGYAKTDSERRAGIEVFVPDENDEIVERWVRDGTAAHVALSLRDRDAFRDVKRFLEEYGFRVPSFKGAEPLTVLKEPDGRNFLTMYLDRLDDRGKVRFEICCHAANVTPSLYPSS